MTRPPLLQYRHRLVEIHPLGHSQPQLTRVLHLLDRQEILPVRVVLDAGHAVRQSVVHRHRVRLPPLRKRRRWNLLEHQGVRRRLPQNACRIPLAVPVDLRSFRIRGLGGNARRRQRRRVRHRHVLVDPAEDRRMPRRHGIQVPSRRQRLSRPQRVVPASALDPRTRRHPSGRLDHIRPDAVLHLLQRLRSRQVGRQLLPPGVSHVRMRVLEPRHRERAMEVDHLGCLGSQLHHLCIRPRGDDRSAPDRNRAHTCRSSRGIRRPQMRSRQDLSIHINGVGRRRRFGIVSGRCLRYRVWRKSTADAGNGEDSKRSKRGHVRSLTSLQSLQRRPIRLHPQRLRQVQNRQNNPSQRRLPPRRVIPLGQRVDPATAAARPYCNRRNPQ